MRRFTSLSRRALLALASLYAITTTGFVVVHSYELRVARSGDPGLEAKYSPADRIFQVVRVIPGGAAEEAGLRSGDRLVALNQRPLEPIPFYELMLSTAAGKTVQLALQRPGREEPLNLSLTLRPAPPPRMFINISERQMFALMFLQAYPVLLLIVAVAVLFLRLDNSNAWLLALVFGGFLATGPLLAQGVAGLKPFEGFIHPAWLRGAFVSFEAVMCVLSPGLFYYFFAIFPERSPLDHRLPWLKFVLLAIPGALAAWLWLLLARAGFVPVTVVLSWLGARSASGIASFLERGLVNLFPICAVASLAFGLVALVSNNLRPVSPEARRKTQVMVWGTVVGVLPDLLIAIAYVVGVAPPTFPLWVFLLTGFLGCLVPLSFAYAVVKHRVLEIPVLLKRSARYLLVKEGFVLITMLITAGAIWLFASVFAQFFRPSWGEAARLPGVSGNSALWAGIAMGIVVGAIATRTNLYVRRRITQKIDRAFFRSAYDARVILQDLAEKTRTATDRHELAKLLEDQIEGALHPKSLACYLEAGDGNLLAECRSGPQRPDRIPGALPRAKFPFRFGALFLPREMDTIPATLPLLKEIAERGKAWDVPQGPEGAGNPGPLEPECLVPILGRNTALVGLLVLGQRLSEEPYSSEDKHLLESVTSQAGIALENIRLAEGMAQRMEAERRAAQEMEYARQVQARLFPQKLPPLTTIEYTGRCVQARQVGGDYYDFLSLGSGRVGIVLADIAGKGIAGALLMANLQANLRSQYVLALEDLPQLLKSVNQLFWENTDDRSYATLFFGDYDDSTRRLRYVNCGHLPPLLLRAGGEIERLAATATVLGLFEEWECRAADVALAPDDILVLYTDGVTEARSAPGEEFGESRLIETLRAQPNLPVPSLLEAVVAAAKGFSQGEQADDVTLVIARCRA